MPQAPQRRGGPATRVARWPGVARGDWRLPVSSPSGANAAAKRRPLTRWQSA